MKTTIFYDDFVDDESVVRLVNDRAQRIADHHPEFSKCRVFIEPKPYRNGSEKEYSVRLYLNQGSCPSMGYVSPGFMDVHIWNSVMKTAMNTAFDKVEELLSPRLDPIHDRIASQKAVLQ